MEHILAWRIHRRNRQRVIMNGAPLASIVTKTVRVLQLRRRRACTVVLSGGPSVCRRAQETLHCLVEDVRIALHVRGGARARAAAAAAAVVAAL